MKTTALLYAGTSANRISCVKNSPKKRELHALPRGEIAGSLAKFTGIAIAKGTSMVTLIRNLLAAMLLMTASLQVHAQGVIDQESATGPVSPYTADFFNMQEDAVLYQSFIPMFSAIGFVQLEFADQPGNGSNGATVVVELFSGSLNSPTLLGSTAPVHMPNGFENDGLGAAGVATFDFSTPITLTPGQTYYLVPMVLPVYQGIVSDNPWDIMVLQNTYAYGQLYSSESGLPEPFDPALDLWFQEGIQAVPEPAIFALFGLGFLIFMFKRRSNLPILIFASLLLSIPVFSVKAADSFVQVTADAAGLTPVSASSLPATGTYWVTTVNPNGGLATLPYPILPTNLDDSPIYSITNDIFLVDSTDGKLSSSDAQMSTVDADSAVQSQSQTMENLIEMIENPPTPPGGTYGAPHPEGLQIDTNGLYLMATNEADSLGFLLFNPIGENYQLLSNSNLLNPSWTLGQILFGANGE